MLEGMYVENIMMHSETRVYPTEPQISAGVIDGSQAIYRYSLRESSYPTLSIVDEISDSQGNIIPPGHYELALSDERDFLILIQSKKPIAIIPVFRVDVDMSTYAVVKDKKALKKELLKNKDVPINGGSSLRIFLVLVLQNPRHFFALSKARFLSLYALIENGKKSNGSLYFPETSFKISAVKTELPQINLLFKNFASIPFAANSASFSFILIFLKSFRSLIVSPVLKDGELFSVIFIFLLKTLKILFCFFNNRF